MNAVTFIDYTGTFVFAISGIMVGVDRKFDLFGVFILGFVTALGGGTLRDLLIGSTPVSWMQADLYVYIVIGSVPLCYIAKGLIIRMKRGIFLFDTLGIGLFTILGMEKTLSLGLSPLIAIMMGVVSAVFGGVIRDVLSGRTPLIFRREIYALACLSGALLYYVAIQFLDGVLPMILAIATVVIVRLFAIRFKWELPFRPLEYKKPQS